MDFYIKTHIVEKGESLEEIASQYDIPEVEMLRNFHNKNVPDVKNCIGWTVSAGHELFIPQKDDILKILNTRKNKINEQFEKQQHRLLNRDFIFPFHKGAYKYEITINDKSERNSFLLEIEHIRETEQKFHLKINQTEMKFNDGEPDRSVEKMAGDINENFFQIELTVNKLGLIEKINEYQHLKTKWNSKKADLYEFFEGNIGKMFLDQIEWNLSDMEKLKKIFNENLLWKLLLNSYLGFYEKGINRKGIVLLDYSFDLKNEVIKSEKQDETYTILQKIWKQNKADEIVAESDYHLDMKTNILQSAEIKLKDWFENLNIIITQIK